MTRPKRAIISRRRAIQAALDVIDTHGIEGFSLVLVAGRLGVRAPSLYHHFKGKDELLTGVARLLLINSPMPPLQPGIDWREAVVAVSRESWRSLLRHPRAAPLLLRFFPRHVLIDAYEHWSKVLSLNGVPIGWHLWILEGSEKLTWGSALFTAASRARSMPPFPSYDLQRHPALTSAIRSNPYDDEETFIEALRSFLRGIAEKS